MPSGTPSGQPPHDLGSALRSRRPRGRRDRRLGQLGQVYAAGLAERGMRVASFDVATGALPDGVRAFEVDVTDRASIAAALERGRRRVGRSAPARQQRGARLAAGCAGGGGRARSRSTPRPRSTRCMDVNVKGDAPLLPGRRRRDGEGGARVDRQRLVRLRPPLAPAGSLRVPADARRDVSTSPSPTRSRRRRS